MDFVAVLGCFGLPSAAASALAARLAADLEIGLNPNANRPFGFGSLAVVRGGVLGELNIASVTASMSVDLCEAGVAGCCSASRSFPR